MSYQSICQELPLLNRKQLDDIRKRAALLLQNQSIRSDTVEDQDWLLEGILHEAQRRGIYVGRSFHIKRSGSFAGFATKSITLRELLLECAPGLSPVQRVRLGQVCARELANYLERAPPTRLINNLKETLAEYPDLSRVRCAAIIQVCVREVMSHQGGGLSFQRMLDRVDWIPSALEHAYPSYMASKLLQLTVPYDGE